MAEHDQLTMVVATMALCAIVGLWYVWVRKLGQSKEQVGEQVPAGASRT